MFIENDKWDNIISESLIMLDLLEDPELYGKYRCTNVERQMNNDMISVLHSVINLNDEPIILKDVHETIEKKSFIIKWALKQLFTFKRKSGNCRKSR